MRQSALGWYDGPMHQQLELATFGGGCFWGTEAAFRKVKGVIETTVGYMGGHTADPSYWDVVSKKTGHAEIVQISFDPSVVSYEQLLDLFWFVHDPTQLNRQGNDVGDEYRSAIFTHTSEQQRLAEASKSRLDKSGSYGTPIVTVIEPAGLFYPAEEYHQRFLEKNPWGYCHVNLHSVDRWLTDHQLARD